MINDPLIRPAAIGIGGIPLDSHEIKRKQVFMADINMPSLESLKTCSHNVLETSGILTPRSDENRVTFLIIPSCNDKARHPCQK